MFLSIFYRGEIGKRLAGTIEVIFDEPCGKGLVEDDDLFLYILAKASVPGLSIAVMMHRLNLKRLASLGERDEEQRSRHTSSLSWDMITNKSNLHDEIQGEWQQPTVLQEF